MSGNDRTRDFVVIGGGIIGLQLAIQLKQRYADASITLLEKEDEVGLHASGRNSGVLHAGFYYTADSLKARFCRIGNQAMRAYCEERKLPLNTCGKLVVARDESELPRLDELKRRGDVNGVPLEAITAAEAKKIEPRVRTHERALFSPTTSTASPKAVIQSMAADAAGMGIEIETGVAFRGRGEKSVTTSAGAIPCGYVVNAAGLYADRIAKDYGFSERYEILPFKGLYLTTREPAQQLATNVYPVPDLRNPFLGVHFTVTVDGRTKIGPTAIPCLWREQYGWLSGFRAGEMLSIAGRSLSLLANAGFDFRGVAREEMKKYRRGYLMSQAAHLVDGLSSDAFRTWAPPGIRAQLLDVKKRTLVMDFCVEGDERSFHVLNAVSPAWTSSIPFSSHVCDQIDALLHRTRPNAESGVAAQSGSA